jgi:hypothetical protein
MSTADPESPDIAQLKTGSISGPYRQWLWLSLAAAALAFAAFAVMSGLGNRILGVLGIILFLDVISGNLFICLFVFARIILPLAITIALVPFSLLWPGDSDDPHWTTVRVRFQTIGRMWRGYWGFDRE